MVKVRDNFDAGETDLLDKISRNNKEAFELLFRRYYQRLLGFAFKFVNDRAEAEEIVQEVFFRIWKNREQLHPCLEIQPYLFRSVQNNCLNFLQHRKRVTEYGELLQLLYRENPACDFSGYERLFARELEAKINESIQLLPEECRRIFQLNRNEGMKYHEIATHLGISVKTVETQMSRALKKLKVELKDYLILLVIALMINQ